MSMMPTVSPRGAAVRALRSVLVGLTVALCGATAHVGAGGEVGAGALLTVAVVASATTALLAGRRLTTGQLVGLLALGQVGLHVLGSGSGPHDASMVLTHVVATGVSLLALRHAEDLWWRLADAVGDVLAVPQVVPVPVVDHVVRVTATVHRGRRVVRTVRSRAPPSAA
ncbi:hypothetical protein [Aeromicrobium sp. Leaf291]|uniref:hypothetical protein n=1 Tax=Aeromicrobium sp. Leaf291 TaxID=1736325 RepID=UPI0012E32DC8|nr:hypothetical protein [Aeromicrobium sp. Leaf291]